MMTVPTFRVDGRVAMVTGASHGLGALFAEVLGLAGASVVVTGRTVDRLAETARLVEATGAQCLVVPGDVANFADCQQAAEAAIAEFGCIDILVSNAGWGDDSLVRSEHVDPASFLKMVVTDLVGLFYTTRAVGPHMLRAGQGSILNLSSILGDGGSANPTAGYFASKGGVNNLTKLLACRWADRGVRVNALAPSICSSEMTRTLLEDSGMADWMRSRTPMRRLRELDELVGPLNCLASAVSSFVTGAILSIDGGYCASSGYAQNPQPWDEWSPLGRPITPSEGSDA